MNDLKTSWSDVQCRYKYIFWWIYQVKINPNCATCPEWQFYSVYPGSHLPWSRMDMAHRLSLLLLFLRNPLNPQQQLLPIRACWPRPSQEAASPGTSHLLWNIDCPTDALHTLARLHWSLYEDSFLLRICVPYCACDPAESRGSVWGTAKYRGALVASLSALVK